MHHVRIRYVAWGCANACRRIMVFVHAVDVVFYSHSYYDKPGGFLPEVLHQLRQIQQMDPERLRAEAQGISMPQVRLLILRLQRINLQFLQISTGHTPKPYDEIPEGDTPAGTGFVPGPPEPVHANAIPENLAISKHVYPDSILSRGPSR